MTKKILQLSSIISKVSENYIATPFGEETMIMNMKSGDYINLNQIGTSIWNLLETPSSIESICLKLIEKFDVDSKTCQEHVIDYLQQLIEQGIIEIK